MKNKAGKQLQYEVTEVHPKDYSTNLHMVYCR